MHYNDASVSQMENTKQILLLFQVLFEPDHLLDLEGLQSAENANWNLMNTYCQRTH